MRVILLLGAPGAGKGTQARILTERLGLAHVATGDLFRAAVREGTPLGREAKAYMDRGELVPDGVTVRMLLERLELPDARDGILLDGFPRNGAQARALDQALVAHDADVEISVLISVPHEELVRRLASRYEIEGRADDHPETVRARFEKQLGGLEEVVEHYRGRGLLAEVDGLAEVGAVTAGLVAAIGTRRRSGS